MMIYSWINRIFTIKDSYRVYWNNQMYCMLDILISNENILFTLRQLDNVTNVARGIKSCVWNTAPISMIFKSLIISCWDLHNHITCVSVVSELVTWLKIQIFTYVHFHYAPLIQTKHAHTYTSKPAPDTFHHFRSSRLAGTHYTYTANIKTY